MKASVPVMSSFGETATFSAPEAPFPSSVNSAFSTERPLASNAAVPKPLAWPSVEPGPIGLPSQEAKRRSDGVDSFRRPVELRQRIVVRLAAEDRGDRRRFDARLERRRAAVQNANGASAPAETRHLLAAPDARAVDGDRLAHARPVDREVDRIEPLAVAGLAVLVDDRAAFEAEIAERHVAGESELQRGGAGIEVPVAAALLRRAPAGRAAAPS